MAFRLTCRAPAQRKEEGATAPRRLTSCLLAIGFATFAVTTAAHASTQEQAHAGARTYKRQCARCHGANGKGKDNQFKGLRAPELIGSNALPCKPRPFQKLRQHDFRTAKDVYDFVSAMMPADQPALLDADEYWDVVAYLLQANGRDTDDTPLNATAAVQIVLHADCPSTTSQGSVKAQR